MDDIETPLTPRARRTLGGRPPSGEPSKRALGSAASMPDFDVSSLGESELQFISAIDTPEIECVSFDVFDTAILRPFLEPADAFRFINHKAGVLLGAPAFNFHQARVEAERQLRLEIDERGERRDPTLEEIYERFRANTGAAMKPARAVMELEQTAELRCAKARAIVGSMYRFAKSLGKRVIFLSDSYLPSRLIASMLEKCGYSGWDGLFVSCEEGVTKKHGELFAVVCERMGLPPRKALHIGDNRRSDLRRGAERGLQTLWLQKPADYCQAPGSLLRVFWPNPSTLTLPARCALAMSVNETLQRAADNAPADSLFKGDARLFGYSAVGNLLLSMLLDMARRVRAERSDKVFFLSRDGHLPLKAWQLLSTRLPLPPGEYLRVSRRSLLPCLLAGPSGADSLLNIRCAEDYTVGDFVNHRLEAARFPAIRDVLGSEIEGILDRPLNAERNRLRQALRAKLTEIRAIADEARVQAEMHFRSRFEGSQRPALFDVGRRGTFQSVLREITGKDIYGYYLLTEGAYGQFNSLDRHDDYFGRITRSLCSEAPDTVLYEALFAESGPTTIGYDAALQPVFDPETSYDPRSAALLDTIQSGALDYVGDALSAFGEDIVELRQDPLESNYLLSNFWASQADYRVIEDLMHEDALSRRRRRPVWTYLTTAIAKAPRAQLRKIAIYCPAMSSIPGGAERVTAYLAERLDKAQMQVRIFTNGDRAIKRPKPVYPLPSAIELVHSSIGEKDATIREDFARFDPDVVVALASGRVVGRIAEAAADLGKPLVLAERAEPEASMRQYWDENARSDYVDAYDRADAIVLQLQSFARSFPQRLQSKIAIIPNPVPQFEALPPQSVRERLIVCVARVRLAQKRQDLLVQAFARIARLHPQWRVEFYGMEWQDDGERLRREIDRLRLDPQVRLMGPISDVAATLRRASIFAFPSAFEGFPNALAEALACGLPAVGFRACPGVNELIVDGENGFLVPGESDALGFSQALDTLISDLDLRQRLGESAARSMARYHPDRILDAWIDCIRNAFDTLGSRGPSLSQLQRHRAAAAFDAVQTHYEPFTKRYNDRVERLIGGLKRRDETIEEQSRRIARLEQILLERNIDPTL